MRHRLTVTHVSDPGCPWAYSAAPALATLMWRYGDQLDWQHVMIGLAEDGSTYEQRGYSGPGMAVAYRDFRERGMPFSTVPRPTVHGTWPMCRVVVAARRLAPEVEWPVFRALQFAQFTTTLDLMTDEALIEAVSAVPGIDAEALVAAAHDEQTETLFAEDRALARSAAGSPTELQGKHAVTPEGEVRYTAPSLLVTDGERSLEAGGFQPLEAYDVVIANLAPDLERRGPAEDVAEAVGAFDHGLTTAEIAAIMAPSLTPPDLGATEDALILAEADGRLQRVTLGHDALWLPAGEPAPHRGDGRFGRAAIAR